MFSGLKVKVNYFDFLLKSMLQCIRNIQMEVLMTVLDLVTKASMAKLLLTDTFSDYTFMEGEVTTFNTFKIDGYLHPEFYDSDDMELIGSKQTHSSWGQVREYFLQMIKGKRTPLKFRIILSLSPAEIEALIEKEGLCLRAKEVQGLYLNFKYEEGILKCTTGTSFHTFNLDKSLEQVWDKEAECILTKLNLL